MSVIPENFSHEMIMDSKFETIKPPNYKFSNTSTWSRSSLRRNKTPRNSLRRSMSSDDCICFICNEIEIATQLDLKIECDFVGFGMVLSESDPPVVKFVSPEGPAVAAGLKTQDCILSLNGTSTSTMDFEDIKAIFLTSRRDFLTGRDSSIRLTVERRQMQQEY
ncbi:uncharacterized protein LOC134842833 [Symsagittifera roscoffensis]|uniref:uncharacterized protein LOC134842833 n=1 Tax=Symsagittifera roscoffensis TaxID=84072 RepID=UPI00307BD553